MSDKEALQVIVFMVSDHVNNNNNPHHDWKLINKLVKFLEENVIHCAMDNNYK